MATASLNPTILAVLSTGDGWVAVVPRVRRSNRKEPMICQIKRRDELNPRQQRKFDTWLGWFSNAGSVA